MQGPLKRSVEETDFWGAFVSHDAGGAEILSSLVRRNQLGGVFALSGPAVSIFERKLGPIENLSLEDALSHCDQVVCGTSWPSTFELEAISMARELEKPSSAYLDHWINYEARFVTEGAQVLPDRMVVGDEYAYQIARAVFPDVDIAMENNPYLLDILDELEKLALLKSSHGGQTLLYVCEPLEVSDQKGRGEVPDKGYDSHRALQFFLDNIELSGSNIEQILVRPHPAEKEGVHDWVLEAYDLPIKVGAKQGLLEQIVNSDVVIGLNSMAMVVGLLAKKRVICAIPPEGLPCTLPQKGIVALKDQLSS